jgi:tetratricopeptide (TPR) repeat protein
MECAQRAAKQAELAGEKKALAQSLLNLGSCRILTGDLSAADDLERALQLHQELGDDISVGKTQNALSAWAYYAYRWDEAARYVALAAETLSKAGNLGFAAMCQCNVGEIRANQGRLDEAVALFVPARRTLESFGYRLIFGHTSLQLGRALAFLGDVEGGLLMMRTAIADFDESGSDFDLLEARARLAEVLVFAERFADARTELAAIRDLERTLGETPLTPLIERVELLLDATAGDRVVPTAEFDAYLERAHNLGAIYEETVVIAFIERLGDRRHHEELVRFMHDLAVVRLPMFRAS